METPYWAVGDGHAGWAARVSAAGPVLDVQVALAAAFSARSASWLVYSSAL